MTVETLQTFGGAPAPRVFGTGAAVAARPTASTLHTLGNTRSTWLTLAAALAATIAFFTVYAIDGAPEFMTCSFLLAVACICFVILHRPAQTLVAAKVASLLYAASFCYAPLWLYEHGAFHVPYYGLDPRPLMGVTACVTLVGYAVFIGSYFLTLRTTRSASPRHYAENPPAATGQRRYALVLGVPMTLLGALCYVKLVIGSGGLAHLLSYSGGRADILAGAYGGWFWGAHLLFTAYGLLAVALMHRHPWLCLALAFLLAGLFFPLQGRDIVVGPVFCWLIFYHTLRKPVPWRTVIAGSLVIILMAAVLGAYRSGGNKVAVHDARSFLTAFTQNADKHLTTVISANVDQLDTAMIGVRYVELQRETLGATPLMSWIAPLDRQFLQNRIPFISTGIFMDLLVNPQHRGWKTGLSPSLPGELYISLGWFGIAAGMLVHGAIFALFTAWSERHTLRPLLFAAYPFVVYMVAKMIVDGTTHLFRPLIVLSAALACALLVPPVRRDLDRSRER